MIEKIERSGSEISNKILLVVDLQKGFINHEVYKDLLTKVENFINKNQKSYTNIIFTKFINTDNSLYKSKLHWTNLTDSESQKIAIKIPDNAIVLEKFGYGLSQKDIVFIKNLGIDQIDICGLQTDACVYAISLQLFDNHIFPNILINYCATSPDRQESAKRMMIHQFGKVDDRV